MVLLLLACTEPGGPSFVAPFDGATGLSPDTALRVHPSELRLPDGEPVAAEVLQVVDLDLGTFVEGETVADDAELVFRPTAAFAPDHDFGWAVIDVAGEARRPVVELEPELVGDALFSTRSHPRPLDASLEDGRLCLLFSEEPTAPVMDLEVDGRQRPQRGWTPMFLSGPGDLDEATAACFDGGLGAEMASVVRVFDEAGGSASVVVGRPSLLAAWKARHRWVVP